ncbi:MAG: ABC transporter permease [Deltaproteobacteria bacterium]|nr:ABC transporter permease [Deltaproteobacteria bacterium]
MGSWYQDLRFGARLMRKSPEITLVAVIALALAIGAASTIFSVVNGMLLQPLPFPDPDRLVAIWQVNSETPEVWRTAAADNFADWRSKSSSFEHMAAIRNRSFTFTSFETPETPLVREASYGYFEILGVSPLVGRTFRPEEDRVGGPPVLLLSYQLWQSRFGGDRDVVGKTTQLDGRPYEIIGVLPADFDNPASGLDVKPKAWVPQALPETGLARLGNNGNLVVARLREGVSIHQAQEEMTRLSEQLRQLRPERNVRVEAHVTPLGENLVRGVRPALLLLLGAVLFVLLVACGNVANLLLTRAVTRRREIALRRALGASLPRLTRQLISESLLMALLSGGLGLLAAYGGTSLVSSLIPDGPGVPRIAIRLDTTVLAFTLAVSLLTGFLFGLAPALHALRGDLEGSLGEGTSRSTETAGGKRIRDGLVVAEVALSLVLLVGAGLLMRSYQQLESLDPGVEKTNVLTFRVSTRGPDYRESSQREAFFQRAVEGLGSLPAVESAGAAQAMPFFGLFQSSPVVLDAQALPEPGSEPQVLIRRLTPGYLETLQVPLLRGRPLSTRDISTAPPVALVSRTMAEELWGSQDPLGETITVKDGLGVSRRVVGIVGDVRSNLNPPEPQSILYLPVAQDPSPQSMGFAIRTRTDRPLSLLSAVRREIQAVDSNMPVYQVRTLEETIDLMDWRLRFLMSLLSCFAALALILATTGIYGVLSYGISQRSKEISIRMALGARRVDVVRLILKSGLALVAAGITAGLAAAMGFSQLLKGQLYGVTAIDGKTYLAVSGLLVAIALAASFIPAFRAARVNPVRSLSQQ